MTVNRLAFIALWLLVFSMPWERSVAIPGIGAAGTLFGLIAFALGVYTVVAGGKIKARVPSLFLILFAFYVVWVGLSFFWGINPGGAQIRATTFAQFLVMAWLIWELCRTQKRHIALLQAYICGAYVVIVSIVYNFLANPFVATRERDLFRYTGIDDNPNFVATAVAIGISIAWYLAMRHQRGLAHWFNLAYLPLSVMALGLIASRSGMLIGVVSLGIIPLTYSYLSTRRKVVLTLLISAVSLGAFSLIPESNIERLSTTGEELATGNVSNRDFIWQAGFKAFQGSPLIGVGAGSYSDAVEAARGFGYPSHNAYIAVLAELGILGLLLFFAVLIVPLLPLLKLPLRERALYIVLWLGILVAFMPNNWETHKTPWFLLTLFTTQRAYVILPNNLPKRRERPRAQLHYERG